MKNKGYAKFGGQLWCIMGNVEVAYTKQSVVNSSLELVPVGLLGYAYVTLLNSTSIAPSETSTL